jgi:hypothetical protein
MWDHGPLFDVSEESMKILVNDMCFMFVHFKMMWHCHNLCFLYFKMNLNEGKEKNEP